MYIAIAIVVLSILMLAHEWGHYLAARKVGIEVREFSLGFGPKLLGFKVNPPLPDMVKTEFALRLIPFGASVRMTGEEMGDESTPYSYTTRSPGQKTLVAASGPLMNFAVAIVIFIVTYTVIGVPVAVNQPVVGGVIPGKPAYEAGIKPKDKILSIDGRPVKKWDEMVRIIRKAKPGQTVLITVEREKEIINFTVQPQWDESQKAAIIGITAPYRLEKKGLLEGIRVGLVNTYVTTLAMLKGLVLLFTGAISTQDMAGPVGITKMIGDAAESGLINLLGFTALLSINLGLLNLLPFPALDGSRIVFALIEAVRGRALEPERENLVHFIGFALLMLLLTLVTYNDIVRLIKGD